MPSDLVVTVRQISNYPPLGASDGTETLLLQQGGPGAPYASISAAALVSTALNGATPLGVGAGIPPQAGGSQIFTADLVTPIDGAHLWNQYQGTDGLQHYWHTGTAAAFEYDPVNGFLWTTAPVGSPGAPVLGLTELMTLNLAGALSLPYGTLNVARDPAAGNEVVTLNYLANNTVQSFNNRKGAVQLNAQDVYNALKLCDPIATQPWVQQAINNSIQNLLYTCPFVNTWNGRKGSVYLMLSDITTVFYQSGQQPISPTPPQDSNDDSIATTKWVTEIGGFLPLSGGTTAGPLLVTATGGNTSRSIQDRWGDALNVKDFGAKGDGVTNDTTAFLNAIGIAYNTKTNTVVIPSGLYLLDGPLIVSPGVVLQGMVPGPMDPPVGGPNFLTQPIGATLLVNAYGANSFIQLNTSNALNDVIIFDPNQVDPTATAPVVKPPMVLMQSPSRMRGVTLVNGYIGVRVLSGRCLVEGCYIGAYKTCVDVDQSADATFFSNIWCGPFYDTAMGHFPWQNMDYWVMNNNGTAFSFARADAVSMVNCGAFIKWCGIYLQDSAVSNPPFSYGWGVNLNWDVCVFGVVANSTNTPGWQFTNMQVLPTGGAPAPAAAAPIYLPAGGAAPPLITWIGGTNAWPASWASPNCIVDAGALTIRGVNNIPDTTSLGITDASQALPGHVGEFVAGANQGGTAMASTVALNVTQISLTAGDWEVTGEMWVIPTGGATMTTVQAAISLTSDGFPSVPIVNGSRAQTSAQQDGAVMLPLGRASIGLTATTTVYLVAMAAFASGGAVAEGVITARRMR